MATTPIKKLRLRRTQQSTIYEAVSAAILLVMWIIGIMAITRHKAETDILIALTIISIGVVVLHLVSYRPIQRWARNDFEIRRCGKQVLPHLRHRGCHDWFVHCHQRFNTLQRQGARGYKGRYGCFRRIRNAHCCKQKAKEGARSREAGTTAEKRKGITRHTPFIRLMFNTIQRKMRKRRETTPLQAEKRMGSPTRLPIFCYCFVIFFTAATPSLSS